jgi:hypothetical protein
MYTRPDGSKDWLAVWMVPAGIAAVVLLLFVLLFNDNTRSKAPKDELVAG